jgi:hypothetical protein
MNILAGTSESLWIDKTEDCTLNGASTSPYFIPKINEVSLRYDEMSGKSSGCFSLIFYFIYLFSNNKREVINSMWYIY